MREEGEGGKSLLPSTVGIDTFRRGDACFRGLQRERVVV